MEWYVKSEVGLSLPKDGLDMDYSFFIEFFKEMQVSASNHLNTLEEIKAFGCCWDWGAQKLAAGKVVSLDRIGYKFSTEELAIWSWKKHLSMLENDQMMQPYLP